MRGLTIVLLVVSACDPVDKATGEESTTDRGNTLEAPGEPTDTTDAPTTGAARHHPAGWSDPAEHGIAAKFQSEECVACHGAELTGGTSAVSCDACHAAGWRTNCTFCHGGVDDASGAPPENIDDTTEADALPRFPAHGAHVAETIHAPFDCAECHARPADVLTPGHVLVGDTTPGEAEVTIARGGTWTAGTCASLTCHGDGQGANGTADASFVSACNGCHPDWTSSEPEIQAMSGEHDRHVSGEGFDCSECHPQTVDASHAIVDPSVHVDGVPTVDPSGTITWDAALRTCDGECHGEAHDGRRWD